MNKDIGQLKREDIEKLIDVGEVIELMRELFI
jgi:hypothetical protein